MQAELQLIVGGARSGKSKLAEARALASKLEKIYIATATAGDDEMAARISCHQASRDQSWQLVEEPLMLAGALEKHCRPDTYVVVDCLTLWLSNCLHADCWEEQQQALFMSLDKIAGQVIFVGNELGMGVVPMGELSRNFVDQQGFLHQKMADLCQRVTLCVAGLPLELKPGVSQGPVQ